MIKVEGMIVFQSINCGDITIMLDGKRLNMEPQAFKRMVCNFIAQNPLKTIDDLIKENSKK